MDLEPGRCRRTDGKKWRCYQLVVPNQKYCETHMHRGRKRSRKLVETSIGSASLNSHNLTFTNTTNKRDNPNNDSKIRNPTILHDKPLLPPSKNPRNSDNSGVKGNNNAGEFKDNVNKGIAVLNQSSELEFSLDSVLQGALRHQSVEKCKLDLNTESERCRRTDGKKWRCSHKVVPHQKYCANHMNRGAKKPVITLISTPSNAKYAFCSAPGINSSGPERTTLSLGLNTNLNIIPRSSSAIVNIEDDSMAGSGGSGSTTETTITDESIDVTDMMAISS